MENILIDFNYLDDLDSHFLIVWSDQTGLVFRKAVRRVTLLFLCRTGASVRRSSFRKPSETGGVYGARNRSRITKSAFTMISEYQNHLANHCENQFCTKKLSSHRQGNKQSENKKRRQTTLPPPETPPNTKKEKKKRKKRRKSSLQNAYPRENPLRTRS